MKVFLASLADQNHAAPLDRFRFLAESDRFGQHTVCESPDVADAVVFVDMQLHPSDPFSYRLRRHPLTAKFPERIAVVDERDLPIYTAPGVYVGATRGLSRRCGAVGGPYPVAGVADIQGADVTPDLLYSFRGAISHRSRRELMAVHHERGRVTDTSHLQFFGSASSEPFVAAQKLFRDEITRSKFVLCPRGHGVSSVRLYETLRLGRVPVIISDAWSPPPFIEWERCSIRIAESDISGVARILEDAEPQWPQLMRGVERAVARHLADDALWNYLMSLVELSMATQPRLPIPWWFEPNTLRMATRISRDRLRARTARLAKARLNGRSEE